MKLHTILCQELVDLRTGQLKTKAFLMRVLGKKLYTKPQPTDYLSRLIPDFSPISTSCTAPAVPKPQCA